jgi:8-oxo-dGTP diphosphatase
MRDHMPTRFPQRVPDDALPPAARGPPKRPLPNHDLRRGAKALITSGDRVLLIKERRNDGSSFWSLPGGGVECDESVPECLRREIVEEIRCQPSVGEPIDACVYCHTNRPVATVYTVFEASLETEPDPNPAEGIVDHDWWVPTELPATTLPPIATVVADAVPRG